MVFICFAELYPSTLKYISGSDAAISNILGMLVMFVSIYWLNKMGGHVHGLGSNDDHNSHSHSHPHSHSHSHEH